MDASDRPLCLSLPLALRTLAVAAFGVMASFFWTYSANVNPTC